MDSPAGESLARLLQHKWALRLLSFLLEGPGRPGRLQRTLPGLSRKVLYQRLDEMMRMGLLARREEGDRYPRRVEFVLRDLPPTVSLLVRALQREGLPLEVVEAVLKCRWMAGILSCLLQGPYRTMALKRALPGISNRVLADRLQKLQRWGLVQRRAWGPQVFYEATARGRALGTLLAHLPREHDGCGSG